MNCLQREPQGFFKMGDNHLKLIAASSPNIAIASDLSAYMNMGYFKSFSSGQFQFFIFHNYHLENCSVPNFFIIWVSSTVFYSFSPNSLIPDGSREYFRL